MRAAGLATLAYYYFDFRDTKKQVRYGLLSSLLSFPPNPTLVAKFSRSCNRTTLAVHESLPAERSLNA